ncbi:MAG: low molecular weight phosphotyrosine protein phosphatase [Bacteroidetes bacterium]|nr:low molecular weight phosphotyrosine protein phosphatase [Bacteroidota bacterium]
MVCLGNICRSPLAEGIMREKISRLGLNWEVDSAGTNGFHVGENPHPLSQKVAKLNGIDISRQVARKFTKHDFESFDRIYVMAADVLQEMKSILGNNISNEKIEFFLNDLYPQQQMDVPDPWYGTEPGYHEVYALIEKGCDAIIEKYMVAKNKTEKV